MRKITHVFTKICILTKRTLLSVQRSQRWSRRQKQPGFDDQAEGWDETFFYMNGFVSFLCTLNKVCFASAFSDIPERDGRDALIAFVFTSYHRPIPSRTWTATKKCQMSKCRPCH